MNSIFYIKENAICINPKICQYLLIIFNTKVKF